MIANSLGLPSETIAVIRRAAPLHDIGKVGIPDAVLLKPGRLTAEEFEAMQEHVTIGAKILAEGRFAVVRFARVIALSHHERWDGTGYPQGLRGEEIPIAGRLVAVADVFDALTHERPYKRAWSVDEAVEEIRQLAGTHFDPQVVEAFETLDHERLVGPAQEYDLGLPAPPLVPTDAE
jgi:putative two-component system response regulator